MNKKTPSQLNDDDLLGSSQQKHNEPDHLNLRMEKSRQRMFLNSEILQTKHQADEFFLIFCS